jgi:hypothetical protein
MDDRPLSEDLRAFLRLLTASEVDFMLVGGYAVALHGFPRATADLDVWINTNPLNVERVLAALREFGFTPDAQAAQALGTPGKVLRMGYPPARIEILTAPAGVEYALCRPRAVTKDALGVPVPTIGLDDLIANKRAAGRTKDLLDAEELERIRARSAR